MRLGFAKTAERIEVPFGVDALGELRNIVLVFGPETPAERGEDFAHCTCCERGDDSMLPSPNYFGRLLTTVTM